MLPPLLLGNAVPLGCKLGTVPYVCSYAASNAGSNEIGHPLTCTITQSKLQGFTFMHLL